MLTTSRQVWPKPLGEPHTADVAAIVPVAGDRLAVLSGQRINVVSRGDGRVLQTLDLPEIGTCLAADRTGQWLVAGTERGTVAVFDGPTYDRLFADMVSANEEGTVVKTGRVRPTSALPFNQHTIDELTASGRLAPAAAGCIQLAWEHRRAILRRG